MFWDKIKRSFRGSIGVDTESVILGDSQGRLNVPGKPHLWLVRRDTSSPAFSVEWSGQGSIPARAGIRVWIGPDYDGVVRIKSINSAALIAGGENPNRYNPSDNRITTWKHPLAGLVAFLANAISTGATASTIVRVLPGTLIDETGYRIYAGGQIDLNTAIPAVNYQRLAMIWLTTSNTLAATISTAKPVVLELSADDWRECVGLAEVQWLPLAAYRLANAQTRITDADKLPAPYQEIRQLLNPPRRLGHPNPITRIERIEAGRQLVAWGLEVENDLIIDGELVIL